MFIKRTSKTSKGKTYVNHLLVESIATENGPRHRVVCSLGSLAPAPRSEWLSLAKRVQSSLAGQPELLPDKKVSGLLAKAIEHRDRGATSLPGNQDVVAIHTERIEVREPREAGAVHVGHQMWRRLGLDSILTEVGLTRRTRQLTEAMVLNRLVRPLSEHAMPQWIRRVALGDILDIDFATLNHHALYRNLDRLHPARTVIEKKLAEREKTLFNLNETILLYDLTSTYFEGRCLRNPQAKLGHSRDKRSDCKQVIVGLVLDQDAFPKAHEVFDGNRVDKSTVSDMLDALEKRTGRKGGATVVVDRGMAYADNLKTIKDREYRYIVAGRQPERHQHLEEFESEEGWEELIRKPSPTNPLQKKSKVYIKRASGKDADVHCLCVSDGRKEKDRAIRAKHEKRLLADLTKLSERIKKGNLVDDSKICEAIGRLKERYPRVARYYEIRFDPATKSFGWTEDALKKARAAELDGGYLLKTDRQDLSADEIWRTYILLTRVESAFRAMKSPLSERPIFHHIERRVQTHIFLCVLAYHLLISIEKTFRDRGVHTSWETLRQTLSTHQVVTLVLPASNGDTLKIRKASTPQDAHRKIYDTLGIPHEVMKPVKTWCTDSHPTKT